MNAKITTFLNSGLLDSYLLGETTSAETQMVETYLSKYIEVQNAYNTLQFNLEVVAKSNAVDAPTHILNAILDEIDDTPVVSMDTSYSKYRTWHKLGIAASMAALALGTWSVSLYTQKEKLTEENQVVVDEIFDLRSDIQMNNQKLDDIMRQFKQLNDPGTYKYIIEGNSRAKNLKTVAYINPKDKTSMIDVE